MLKIVCNKLITSIDFIFYATVTCLCWILSMTVLLPFVILLTFSQTTRDKFFPWIFSRIVLPISKPMVLPLRKKPFDLLKEQLSQRDTTVPLRVLEIGIGGGENLEFYPENSKLIALDRNQFFETYFTENREKYPNVHFEKMIIGMAEDMHQLEDSSVDVVVSTYVFCSVTDAVAVLREVKRVLKTGGKFAFLEHVAFPTNRWGLTIQHWATPLWVLYFAGCHPNRNTAARIESAGFSDFTNYCIEVPFQIIWIRPQIYGIATK